MASQGDGEPRTSRLQQMQMRFQQKTHQEQEQRRADLATAKKNGNSALTSATHPGKVRQMFDERRRGAGIDRSNPLKPIASVVSTSSLTSPKGRAQQDQQKLVKGITAMSLKESATSVTVKRRQASDNNINNNKYNAAGTINRLKPVITRKTPPTQEKDNQNRYVSTPPKSPKPMPAATIKIKPSIIRPVESTVPHTRKPPVRKIGPKSPVTKNNMQNQPAPAGTETCRFCGRHFLTERLDKHEAVCQRTMNTKRKIFDASKQRNVGTENERYVKKTKTGVRTQASYSSAAQQQGLSTGVKKSNWRKKHEDFIQSIRAAKQLKAHLARGGKLSDLPPPPPSENADYIKCPHCGRRFNQQAAERHIPRCATMIHNKPRRDGPPPAKKR
ncbi:uncharacterized protein [Drosophila tropicalis]|uniref:uncharacterized protein n=1 Tax=Drosophila tropicalis TaxID=46794 RepID=UPI0035ABCB26